MTNTEIQEILKMRMAVYSAGVEKGFWKSIVDASDMLEYIFLKSGQLAFYQLLMEQMRVEHSNLMGGVYYLFKMPVQIEKEITEFLRKEKTNIKDLVSNPKEYLAEMDTIPTDHCLTEVNVGAFSTQNISNLLRLCASHYRYSFESNIHSYPYFR